MKNSKKTLTDGAATKWRITKAVNARPLVNVVFLTFSVYLLALVFMPIKRVFPVVWEAVFFLIITAFFALLGSFLQKKSRLNSKNLNNRNLNWYKLSKTVTIISFLGIIVSLIDRFFIRGVGLGFDAFEAREALEASSAGIISMIAAYMASFSAFGVIAQWIAEEYDGRIGGVHKMLAYANLILYIYLSTMLGSRSLLIVVVICHIFARSTLRKSQDKSTDYKSIMALISMVIVTIAGLIYILQQRLDLMGISALESIQYSTYSFTLKVNDFLLDSIRGSEVVESIGAALFSMILYVFHGVFEFIYLFQNLDGHHTYGAETFWLPFKIWGAMGGPLNVIDLESISNYRSGVFTTFAGPLYVDFGLAAPLAAGIIFYLLSFPQRLAANGKIQWIPAALQCETIIVLSPILNLLQSATGTYLLIAAVSIAVIGSLGGARRDGQSKNLHEIKASILVSN